MNWLIGNWVGRLAIVIQACVLGATIFWCSKFFREDREDEVKELSAAESAYRFANENKGFLQTDKEALEARRFRVTDEIVKNHQGKRQKAVVFCVASNLAVPILLAVGWFIVKGLPRRKIPPSS